MASGIGIDEVCIRNSTLNNLKQILNPAVQHRAYLPAKCKEITDASF